MLCDLTAVDWLNKKEKRFEVVYHYGTLSKKR
jgi:NADH:ubiquinone oxidoreductase subunit C